MVEYSHTTIDFATWPESPLVSLLDEQTHLKETIHLSHQNLMQEINVDITVG